MSQRPTSGRGAVRIVGGLWRGRKIPVANADTLRPTHERAREAIFNRLIHATDTLGVAIRGARVADLFAGSGALGFEALSRGAAWATFVEQDRGTAKAIESMLDKLAADDRADVLNIDATKLPRARQTFDIVLMDPPYGKGLVTAALQSMAAQGWVGTGGLIVTEIDEGDNLMLPEGYSPIDTRSYGRAHIAFIKFNA